MLEDVEQNIIKEKEINKNRRLFKHLRIRKMMRSQQTMSLGIIFNKAKIVSLEVKYEQRIVT